MTPADLAYSLRRFADYATVVEEPHRQAARHAADALDAMHPGTADSVLNGSSHLDHLLALLADPKKFKAAKDDLHKRASEARTMYEKALAEREQAAADKAAAEKHKAAAQADLERIDAVSKDAQTRRVNDEKRLSDRETELSRRLETVKKQEADVSQREQEAEQHYAELSKRKADLDAREKAIAIDEQRLAKQRDTLQRRAAMLAEPI